MKKLTYIIFAFMVLVNTACEDQFLESDAPSAVDEAVMFTTPSEATSFLMGIYDDWYGVPRLLHYETEAVGSDEGTHPENYSSQGRHIPEGLFATEFPIDDGNSRNTWLDFYKCIGRANIMLDVIASKPEYQAAVEAGNPTAWTHLYGEALTMRANMYRLLIRWFGDVPYLATAVRTRDQANVGSTSRDEIYDGEIAALQAAEPLMYHIGENGLNAERFTRSYALALIGELALDAAGWQTRRTDFDYGSVSFEMKGVENSTWEAKYVRRTDWEDYMDIAKVYLARAIDEGGASLITADDRGPGFENPFQRAFQYNMDLEVSPESLYEAGYTRGFNSDFPYSFGRPSGGGGSNAYPTKNYGQGRIHASYYYGDFDPEDKRRDVTACVTSNSGAASEKMIDFTPGSREKGGLANNKLDESRFADPYTASQRRSGCNWAMLRVSDVILNLAYAYAMTGEEGNARAEFKKVRSRAFSAANQADKVNAYVDGLSGQALIDGIMHERMLELGGEGRVRWDMIVSGKMPERIKARRDAQIAIVEGLKTDGYYTFDNGVTISNYIWTKYVRMGDIDPNLNLLTTQTPDGITTADPRYPVLVPGWRGTSDLWVDYIATLPSDQVNLAIKGLYTYIDPDGPEAALLEADGYVKTDWGSNIVANESQYTTDIFLGYPDSYVTEGQPPRYVRAVPSETILLSNGLITQGYGHYDPTTEQ
ncbi:MAG: RagB/SusD family nutrient uptake outer membrane protein [Cyclobacteriaceae bacterium]